MLIILIMNVNDRFLTQLYTPTGFSMALLSKLSIDWDINKIINFKYHCCSFYHNLIFFPNLWNPQNPDVQQFYRLED